MHAIVTTLQSWSEVKEDEGVKVWAYGKTAYQTLLGYVLDPDYGDITDPDSGTDIVLNYDVPVLPAHSQRQLLSLVVVPPFYVMMR